MLPVNNGGSKRVAENVRKCKYLNHSKFREIKNTTKRVCPKFMKR
jgi:hypothetical protein